MDRTEHEEMRCLRCGKPMVLVRAAQWHTRHTGNTGNLLLRQMQKLADSVGIQIRHCAEGCGRLEFFKQPENDSSPANTKKKEHEP